MSSPPTSLTPTALLPSTSTFATGLPRLISTPRSRHTFAMIAVIAPMPPTLWHHAPFLPFTPPTPWCSRPSALAGVSGDPYFPTPASDPNPALPYAHPHTLPPTVGPPT